MKKTGFLKLLLVPAILLTVLMLFTVSTSAAEEFSAEEIELSASSSKNIEYNITADASSTLWAMNFTVEFDSDIFTLTKIETDPRFTLAYTVQDGKCTLLLYSKDAANITVTEGTEVVTLSFTVSRDIQPGAYSITFRPASDSMVTYSGTVKDMHVGGGTLFYGNRIKYISNGKVLSSEFAAAGDTIYPSDGTSDNPDEIFIGWYSQSDSYHGKIFTAPGESFVLGNYDVTLEAVYLEIKTLPGASIYFPYENNDIRLRYISAVNRKQYDFLLNNVFGGDASSLILGTLICPTSYAENNATDSLNGGMDFDALKNDRDAVQTSVPKAPGTWLDSGSVSAIGGSSEYYYYEGILNNIIRDTVPEDGDIVNYDTEFSAIAYITLTYPSGQTVDHFAKYSPESHSRSVRYVVTRALNDVSLVYTDFYRFKIDDVYRPYSPSQTAALYRIRAGM